MPEMTALGVAMAAGLAEGINAWHVEKGESSTGRMQKFTPKLPSDGETAQKQFIFML
jgi:glycerol kinase